MSTAPACSRKPPPASPRDNADFADNAGRVSAAFALAYEGGERPDSAPLRVEGEMRVALVSLIA
jgi:hypothetical protein